MKKQLGSKDDSTGGGGCTKNKRVGESRGEFFLPDPDRGARERLVTSILRGRGRAGGAYSAWRTDKATHQQ